MQRTSTSQNREELMRYKSTEYTIVENALADAVLSGNIGRRLGEPIKVAPDYPHWTSPGRFELDVTEHAYVIWSEKLIAIDSHGAWIDFQQHLESVAAHSPDQNVYQLVAVDHETHMKLFHKHPTRVRRQDVSYWAVRTHLIDPMEQFRVVDDKWTKWLLRRKKNWYNAADPSRATRRRMSTEHVYAVMQWKDETLIACVDTDLKWYLFKCYRYIHTTIRPVPNLYTYDTIPTRFIVVSEKKFKKIEASATTIEWEYGRHS